jgi:hypothetical protein
MEVLSAAFDVLDGVSKSVWILSKGVNRRDDRAIGRRSSSPLALLPEDHAAGSRLGNPGHRDAMNALIVGDDGVAVTRCVLEQKPRLGSPLGTYRWHG